MKLDLHRHKRELSAALAYLGLLLAMGLVAPGFFRADNVRDLAVNNAPVLIVAAGMTLVILAGEIDISVGSQFAVCGVAVAWMAKAGVPAAALPVAALLVGAALGAINGLLVGGLRLPSIIVTLATYVAWRDALRWGTQGAWVQDLPRDFQWFGLGQQAGEFLIVGAGVTVLLALAWALHSVAAGRWVYAVGSDAEAARLAGIAPGRVVLVVFTLMGGLTGLAALLNATRFSAVPSNLGSGLELKAIAAVVVGGTAITGGRGTMLGTLIGTALLGSIGTALTFSGVNPFWEKAIQGAIILAAVASDVALGKLNHHVRGTVSRAAAH